MSAIVIQHEANLLILSLAVAVNISDIHDFQMLLDKQTIKISSII